MDLNDPDQYRTPKNLAARINVHVRYSAADDDWLSWLRRIVAPTPSCRILDVGCGTGDIWATQETSESRPENVVLTDRSRGMVESATSATGLTGVVADAARFPFASDSFDIVLAAHMLYHVEDPASAIAETARVIRKGGRFIASTNGALHMRELDDLTGHEPIKLSFDLDSGAEFLRTAFESVVVHRRNDELRITDGSDAVDYLDSYRDLTDDDRVRIRAAIDRDITKSGFFRVGKEMGVFECAHPV
ncbi:MAG: class I SAM-dependent methyltransferase [Actinomycetota bacterium]